jgi:hypothetical protein
MIHRMNFSKIINYLIIVNKKRLINELVRKVIEFLVCELRQKIEANMGVLRRY